MKRSNKKLNVKHIDNIENDSESYHIKPDLVLRIKGQLVEYRDIR